MESLISHMANQMAEPLPDPDSGSKACAFLSVWYYNAVYVCMHMCMCVRACIKGLDGYT